MLMLVIVMALMKVGKVRNEDSDDKDERNFVIAKPR